MEIKRLMAPMACEDIVALWTEIFGADEAALEKPQIDGSETEFNNDVMYLAYEGETLVGTIHATFPKNAPYLCGLSGMCTRESVRGTGLGRILFQKIVEEADTQGALYTFLGTGNPLAAKLYHSCGFSFLPGSNVMARFSEGDRIDMDRRFFLKVPEEFTVCEGNPSLRIPLIPFVLYRGPHFLMDINTGIFSSDIVNQVSCMGLYPRYEDLKREGGQWFAAVSKETGIPGALLSVKETDTGRRADFFYAEGFTNTIPALFESVSTDKDLYFMVSERDTEKQRILSQLGYRPLEESLETVREFSVPCVKYKK